MTALADEIQHQTRIVRRQAGPLTCWQMVCSCGCASPQATDKYVAIIARRSHLRDVGKAVDDD